MDRIQSGMPLQHQFGPLCMHYNYSWLETFHLNIFFKVKKNGFLWENATFSKNASIFHRENVSKIHSFRSSQLDSKYFSLSS